MKQMLKCHRLSSIALSIAAAGLTTLATVPTQAGVNMRRGAFTKDVIDLDQNGLQITRTYDSRSSFNGLFGFGWCSEFDSRLDLRDNAGATINDCGRLEKIKPTKEPGTYERWAHRGSDGRRRIYDEKGRLSEIELTTKIIRLTYDHERLKEISDDLGQRLFLTLDSAQRHVRKIETLGPQKVLYAFDQDNLTSVQNGWSNTYSYHYDDLHNLTRIEYPDHTTERLTYDSRLDTVASYSGRDGCSESYVFRSTPEHLASRSVKTCGTQEITRVRFDFWFTHNIANSISLDHARVTVQPSGQREMTTELRYHPVTGQILSRRNS